MAMLVAVITVLTIFGSRYDSLKVYLLLPQAVFALMFDLEVVGLFCLGYAAEAATLGFDVYATREKHPKCVFIRTCMTFVLTTHFSSHRHVRYGLFFHSLSLIGCLREGNLSDDFRRRYLDQVALNQKFISR